MFFTFDNQLDIFRELKNVDEVVAGTVPSLKPISKAFPSALPHASAISNQQIGRNKSFGSPPCIRNVL